jgi:plasmid stabilization system protein ParE
MTRGYVLTPEAEATIDEILGFVASRFGSLVADRVYADFLDAFRLLASSLYVIKIHSLAQVEPLRRQRVRHAALRHA